MKTIAKGELAPHDGILLNHEEKLIFKDLLLYVKNNRAIDKEFAEKELLFIKPEKVRV